MIDDRGRNGQLDIALFELKNTSDFHSPGYIERYQRREDIFYIIGPWRGRDYVHVKCVELRKRHFVAWRTEAHHNVQSSGGIIEYNRDVFDDDGGIDELTGGFLNQFINDRFDGPSGGDVRLSRMRVFDFLERVVEEKPDIEVGEKRIV